MKWVHLGFDKPGCVMGIVSRDANYLNTIPRLTKDVVVVAANRSVVALLAFGTTAVYDGIE